MCSPLICGKALSWDDQRVKLSSLDKLLVYSETGLPCGFRNTTRKVLFTYISIYTCTYERVLRINIRLHISVKIRFSFQPILTHIVSSKWTQVHKKNCSCLAKKHLASGQPRQQPPPLCPVGCFRW